MVYTLFCKGVCYLSYSRGLFQDKQTTEPESHEETDQSLLLRFKIGLSSHLGSQGHNVEPSPLHSELSSFLRDDSSLFTLWEMDDPRPGQHLTLRCETEAAFDGMVFKLYLMYCTTFVCTGNEERKNSRLC